MPMVQRTRRDFQFEEKLEIPLEVQEKISCAANGPTLAADYIVRELKFVSVSDSRYLIPKRVLDVILSAIALIIIAIPMLIIFVIMYFDDPGNIIFSQ